MATMYAIAALTTWDIAAGGWSSSSGGASNGQYPISTTNVIFDNNSGPARTIAVANASCNTINVPAAQVISFNSGQIMVSNSLTATCNLGASVGANLYIIGSTYLSCTTGSLYGLTFNCDGGSLFLSSDVAVTNNILFNDGSFYLGGYNLTCGGLNMQYNNTFPTLDWGGTVTITGVGTGVGFQTNYQVTGNILKFINSGATGVYVSASSSVTLNTLWIANTGTGGTIVNQALASVGTLKMSAGSFLNLQAGITVSSGVAIDGTGAVAKILGNGSYLTKSGGGKAYVDYCDLTNVGSNPVSTWYARNSINNGGNTNWTFIPANSKMLSFF